MSVAPEVHVRGAVPNVIQPAPVAPQSRSTRSAHIPRRLVGLSPQVEAERAETKEFLYRNLYYSPALQPEKEDAERVITQLFDLWMKRPEKLPASYQEKAKNESEPRARVVCDYIAGMTDTYIYEQYEKYCGP